MKKRFYYLAIAGYLIGNSSSFPSWEPTPLVFKAPSYIDLEFDKIDFQRTMFVSDYSKRKVFYKIVHQYYKIPSTTVDYSPLDAAPKERDLPQGSFLENLKDLTHSKKVTINDSVWQDFQRHCHDNKDLFQRVEAFFKAVITDITAPDLAEPLLKIRLQLCQGRYLIQKQQDDLLNDIKKLQENPQREPYAAYLSVVYFHELDQMEEASAALEQLIQKLRSDSSNKYAWLKETALYLSGRFPLILSQKDWDGYGALEGKINLSLVEKASQGFDRYLTAYPKGIYVQSTVNLQRRILFLSGKKQELSQAVKARLNAFFESLKEGQRLPNEFDSFVTEMKLYLQGELDYIKDHPLIIAFRILYDEKPTVEHLQKLREIKDRFKSSPDLFTYLETQILYYLKKYDDVLAITSPTIQENALYSQSIRTLQAKSYAAKGMEEDSLNIWKDMYQQAPEDTIAIEMMNVLLSLKRPKDFFDLNISNLNLLAAYSELGVPTADLRDLLNRETLPASVQEIVSSELLKRDLLSRNYKGFVEVFEKMGKRHLSVYGDIPYQDILPQIQALSKNNKSYKDLLDVAKFIFKTFISPLVHITEDNQLKLMNPKLESLMTWTKEFVPPFQLFKEISDHFHKNGKKSDLEAEALSYLVKCFKAGENQTRCHLSSSTDCFMSGSQARCHLTQEMTNNISQESFRRLHKKYPNSLWAKKTKYYY
jgi:tetratricopeptide (TPR) repeat protein